MTDLSTQFQTPAFAAKYMAGLIPPGTKTILEPTPGIGNIIAELTGYDVTAPADFFLLDTSLRFDCVIMNPPFSGKFANLTHAPAHYKKDGMRMGYQMLKDCMLLSDNIIALMPWFTLVDSDVRQRELYRFGLKSLTALPRKTFAYIRIQTMVMQLVKGYNGPTEFKVFDCLEDNNT